MTEAMIGIYMIPIIPNAAKLTAEGKMTNNNEPNNK